MLKKYKSQNSDQIPAELIPVVGEILLSVIHKLVNCVFNGEKIPDKWKESVIAPIYKTGDKTDCTIYRGEPINLVRLTKICSTVRINKHLSDNFLVENGLKQSDALLQLYFNVALEYSIREVHGNQLGLQLNKTNLLLAYADDMNVVGDKIYI
jgi:hypothetical protein